MTHKPRATWVSRKERDIWCLDFAGLGGDRADLLAEIEASQAVMRVQPANSMLVALVLDEAGATPEVVNFINTYACLERNPIHKMAILGLTHWQRFWLSRRQGVTWPKNARFFDDYELAKDWLVEDRF